MGERNFEIINCEAIKTSESFQVNSPFKIQNISIFKLRFFFFLLHCYQKNFFFGISGLSFLHRPSVARIEHSSLVCFSPSLNLYFFFIRTNFSILFLSSQLPSHPPTSSCWRIFFVFLTVDSFETILKHFLLTIFHFRSSFNNIIQTPQQPFKTFHQSLHKHYSRNQKNPKTTMELSQGSPIFYTTK